MIQIFRIVALVEGVTTLLLFLVAMPMKYLLDMPFLTPPVGAIHGIAFLAYIGAMWVCLRDYAFSAKDWARTAIAAFFPFGTFLNDPFLKRKQAEATGSLSR
jgi:integral membrane protein